ncbi:MAG: hypothetical protein HZA25_02675 [Candidatus Niyogibacteria bacterium]|nr:hypothetical protein [Candidatus Niyogibacteria bacterium]
MNSGQKNLILTVLFSAALLLTPAASYAVPTGSASDAFNAITSTKTTVSAVANKAVAYKETVLDTIAFTMAKAVLSDLTKSTVSWIKSGFDSNGNPFIPSNYNSWVQDAADKAGGNFLDDLTNGKFSQFCSPTGFNIGLSLPRAEPFEIKTKCSLSEFGNNWQTAYDSAAKGDWSAWLQISRPENNPYGQILLSWEEKNRRANAAGDKQKTDLSLNKGVLSLSESQPSTEADQACIDNCDAEYNRAVENKWEGLTGQSYYDACITACVDAVGKRITTPGEQINAQLTTALGSGWAKLEAADELNEVLGALVSYALSQVTDGLIPRGTSSSGSASSGSSSSGSSYSSYNNYSVTKTYSPGELAKDLFKIKYNLYDYKILTYNSKFKPGSNSDSSCDPTNDETCDPEARDIYKAAYKQQKGVTDDSAYDQDCSNFAGYDANHIFNYDSASMEKYCGVLAYNLKTQSGGTVSVNAFDLVKRTPSSISPPGMALYFYRTIDTLRLNNAYSDLMNAYSFAAVNNATSNTPIEVQCNLRGKRYNFNDAKSLIQSELASSGGDVNTFDNYFSANSTYDTLRKLIRSAEDSLATYNTEYGTDPASAATANAQYELDNIAESITSIKDKLPSIPEQISKRIDDMNYYSTGLSCYREYTAADGTKYSNETQCLNETAAYLAEHPDFEYTVDNINRLYGLTGSGASSNPFTLTNSNVVSSVGSGAGVAAASGILVPSLMTYSIPVVGVLVGPAMILSTGGSIGKAAGSAVGGTLGATLGWSLAGPVGGWVGATFGSLMGSILFGDSGETGPSVANMHCGTDAPACDTYGGAITVSGTKTDTCNGDTKNQFSCTDSTNNSASETTIASGCTDVYEGGTSGEIGAVSTDTSGNTSGGGGSISTPKYWRKVTCYAGADAFPDYCAAQASSGDSGTGGPTVMCTTGESTPNPNTGENYYTVALCTTRALCDQYYNGNHDCYGDLYVGVNGYTERQAIDALNMACWGQDSASMDDATFNATSYFNNHSSERYACLRDHGNLP